ncbi:HAD-IA family hydrolase [Candidatus Roizmanbacteria bacterium]|nr:HAD-IA family hydrolase [Candidatus Roizmanbacteria bacterium]
MITTLIFDLGGVVLKHSRTIQSDILKEMFPEDQEEILRIWEEFKNPLTIGTETIEQFLQRVQLSIHTSYTVAQLKEQLAAHYKDRTVVDRELLELVDRLRNAYETVLFTDTIALHHAVNTTRHIFEHFDKMYTSFEERISKVEGKRAFAYLLRKINKDPEECLVVDDREENILAAGQLRIKGIVYNNTLQLQKELTSNGILLNSYGR